MNDVINTYREKKEKQEFLDIQHEFEFIDNVLQVANEAIIQTPVESEAYKNAILIKNYFGEKHYSLSSAIEMRRKEKRIRDVKAAWYRKTNNKKSES